jgi:hypothetical protein
MVAKTIKRTDRTTARECQLLEQTDRVQTNVKQTSSGKQCQPIDLIKQTKIQALAN